MTTKTHQNPILQVIADMTEGPAQLPDVPTLPGESEEQAQTRLALVTAQEAVMHWFGSIFEDHGMHHSIERLESSPDWQEAEDNVRYAWGMADGPRADRIERVVSAAQHAANIADYASRLETGRTASPDFTKGTLMLEAVQLTGKMSSSARKHGDPDRRTRMIQKLTDRISTAPTQEDRDTQPLVYRMFRTANEQWRLTIAGQLTALEDITRSLTAAETGQSTDQDALQALEEAQGALQRARRARARRALAD